MVGTSCPHVEAWHKSRGSHAWLPLQRALTGPASTSQLPPESHKSIATDGGSAYLCVSCGEVGSLRQLFRHSRAAGAGHELQVDLERRELYCYACRDYVYDVSFDEAVMAVQAALLKQRKEEWPDMRGAVSASPTTPRTRAGIPRIKLPSSWQHKGPGSQVLQGAVIVTPPTGLPVGLRGLSNLGNTCFMNSVLQALLHAPLLRAFFLGAGHPRELCQQGQATGQCLSCELDRAFGEQYSGAHQPFSPVDLLYAWWTYADHLAGYQQHDAHEFYLTLLCAMDGATDGVRGMLQKHLKLEAAEESPAKDEHLRDESVAESVFGGILRSDVTCNGCGYTSTAYDPFLDISLDLHSFPKAFNCLPAARGPGSVASDLPGGPGNSGMDSGMESTAAEAGPHAISRLAEPPKKRPRGRPRKRPLTLLREDIYEGSGRADGPVVERHNSWQQAQADAPAEDLSVDSPDDEAASDVDDGSSILGGATDSMGGDTNSPPDAAVALVLSSLGDSKGVGKKKMVRARRCGHCYHCSNKQLKKACLNSIKEPGQAVLQTTGGQGGQPTSAGGSEGRPLGSKGATLVGGDFNGAGGIAASLVGCLHSFMRSEKIGATERWVCERCQKQQQATKQMSIRRLPPVLCLHIKRFEHNGHKKIARKVDTPLIFPMKCLDMSPFTSATVLRQRFSSRNGTTSKADTKKAVYELYAVISHRGKMEGGHYIAFIKVGKQWYQCDDSWVVPVRPDIVSKCQAYMLYYKRKEASL